MAVPVVSLDQVNAPDADPDTAPHKISFDPAKDDVSVDFDVTFNGPWLRMRGTVAPAGSTSRLDGALVTDYGGVVCGMDILGYGNSRLAGGTRADGVVDIFANVNQYGAFDEGEGDYDLYLDVLNADGWNVRS